MKDLTSDLAQSYDLSTKVDHVLQRRVELAQERFNDRIQAAYRKHLEGLAARPTSPWEIFARWQEYATDLTQRSILFWETLRQRGSNYLAHDRAGKPPVLHFDYETVLDARKRPRPVNYALLRILPPAGVTVDPKRRPYLIIDPRAGHGPGIGGFKDDSQVGVALREGHPVYFVVFFPKPEPRQTLLDVCEAEAEFVHAVRRLHPDSPKPAIVGNCQGGWAAMMPAAAAEAAKAQRQPADSAQPFRQLEGMMSELVSGSLDLFRDVRDALSEALFFQLYGNLFLSHMGAGERAEEEDRPETPDPRTLPFVRDALASVAEGGFPEALARVGALLAWRGTPIPLGRLELKEALIGDYKDLLPDLPREAMRRIRGEQEIIVQYEPEQALETLPQLLKESADRDRLRTLLERLLADPRLPRGKLTPPQDELIGRIRALLGGHAATKTKLRNGLRL
jgi:hypothetical protein